MFNSELNSNLSNVDTTGWIQAKRRSQPSNSTNGQTLTKTGIKKGQKVLIFAAFEGNYGPSVTVKANDIEVSGYKRIFYDYINYLVAEDANPSDKVIDGDDYFIYEATEDCDITITTCSGTQSVSSSDTIDVIVCIPL